MSARNDETHMHNMTPGRLLLMAALHYVAMFILMYAMVDRLDNIFINLNQAYMAAIMTTPMLLIEIVLMGSMYANKRALMTIAGVSVFVFAAAFIFIRQQTGIRDKEFLRSMISHHASAILMCDKAAITDPEIQDLCGTIEASQQEQIDWMKTKLQELN